MKKRPDFHLAVNADAWAIGNVRPTGRLSIRKVVWGRLMARYEKRDGEVIRRAFILCRR